MATQAKTRKKEKTETYDESQIKTREQLKIRSDIFLTKFLTSGVLHKRFNRERTEIPPTLFLAPPN